MSGVFTTAGPRGLAYSRRTFEGWITADSLSELESKYKALADKAEKFAGRPLTPHEMVNGITKPEPSRKEVIEARREQANVAYAERIADEALHDPAAVRLKTAQQAAEQERRSKLSHVERELEDAQIAAEAARQRREDKQRLAEIKATPTYKSLREALDDTLLVSKLDASVSQDAVDAIESQIAQLERTGDIASVRANLATIQRAISEQTAIQDAELQQANDRAELRRKMLSAGQVWDSIDVETIGHMSFVVLQSGGKTVKVSQATYDARQSDEALKAQLFSGEATND